MWSKKFERHGKRCEVRFARGLDDFPEARSIREEVFIREQGFKNEFDRTDASAWHCVVFIEGEAAAAGRLYRDANEPFTAHIGRLAVIKRHRGSGLGSLVTGFLEQLARNEGYGRIVLSAQCRAQAFYRANGYTPEGGVYLDEHVEHIRMTKDL